MGLWPKNMLEEEMVARPVTEDAPVHLGCCDTWLAERHIPAWKERTSSHHRPGLLED